MNLIDAIANVFENHRRAGGGGDPREAARNVLAALVGSDDEPGPLDKYTVETVRPDGRKPVVVWRCSGGHEGCTDGHLGVIARDLELSQTGLTLGEFVSAVMSHEEEPDEG